jgi:hypothetical protein
MTDVLKQAKAIDADLAAICCNMDDKYHEKYAELAEQALELIGALAARHEVALAGVRGAGLLIGELRDRPEVAEAKYERLQSTMMEIDGHRKIIELQEELSRWQKIAKNTGRSAGCWRREAAKLQKIAIDERAGKLILTRDCTQNEDAADFHHRCECGYSLEKCPIADWWREQAARELGITIECQHEQQIASKDAVRCVRCGKMLHFEEITGRAIRTGIATSDHIREPTKMMLTKEQRAALEYAISSLEQCDSEPEDPICIKILQSMLDQSRPTWEITEDRKIALHQVEMLLTGNQPKDLHWDIRAIVIIRAMITEASQ